MVAAKVYDVTSWVEQHPGGDVLLSYAGRDATDVFTAFHSDSGWSRLKDLKCGHYIGKVEGALVPGGPKKECKCS